MNLSLRRTSETPLYRQLYTTMARQIRNGDLKPGARIPSVRSLARTLSVSPITVVQAYNLLTAEGIIHATMGRGTFVAAPSPDSGHEEERRIDLPAGAAGRDGEWQSALAVYLHAPRFTAMQTLLRPGRRRGVISLAAGTPDPNLFPLRALGRLWGRVMAVENPRFLQYGSPLGDYHLRSWIAAQCTGLGISTRAEDILITSGSQQAIDIVARTFVGPGDHVLVESPTFVTALDIFEARGARLLGVPLDAGGMRVDAAAPLVERYRPKLIYTIPTAQNPTGTAMSEDRRRQLAALARRHKILILEDDICSEFTYDGDPPVAVKSFDTGGHVAFVLSFSKTVIPGLRVGCIIAQGEILARLIEAKLVADRFTSPLIQRTLWRYLSSRKYRKDLATARETYRRRRDAILRALRTTMPAGVTWSHPTSGFNLWINLPDGVPAADAFEEGLKEGVACAVGDLCLPHVPPPSGLRVSFADNPEEVVVEGIRRLGRAITRVLAGAKRVEDHDAEFVTTV
jgi:DNA-binding transcriptional MocR family regulator